MPQACKAIRETLILGSGPAGLTAAIYAARGRCCPLLIHGQQPGGQLTTTTVIDNFPGFPEGVDGTALMDRMQEQAERFGTDFVEGEVTRVELAKRPFKVWLGDECYQCQTLIIATGASPRMLGLPNEWELYGRGVSVCATCDGFFYKGKKVVVVGGGDTAMEEASFLTRFADHVTVVHRRDTLRASPPLEKRARENKKITFRWETVVTEILGDKQSGVTGVRVLHHPSGEEEEIPCDGVFIAIGHTPNTKIFKGQLEMDPEGYLITRGNCETNIPGVFAAGDVQDAHFRQAITAAGSGCMAAILAERYLEGLDDQEE
ncbi:thioredoxin reductase [Desulfuromonas versatilis]|uniref:Thioredoxin reductase n=1 Tax=Desulfuromonas versatilis TaxID=2802975 RepID=A0ABN6E3R5_9BACT|nr:thioredoxin-disulfide reductase [Desulfuromonas versatilis]BCR06444.1 thioredoxin reductase [Desulfuromonas versatilis]